MKHATLKIDNPCNEDWDAMHTTDNGRFCSHCQHSVLDFTTLTDNEVLNIIEKTEGKLCGRFRPDQLNRLMVETANSNTNPALYKILAGLLLLSTSAIATAKQPAPDTTAAIQTHHVTMGRFAALGTDTCKNEGVKNVIHGQVLDAVNKTPMSNVEVKIVGSLVQTKTDNEGKFKLEVPPNLLNGNLQISAVQPGFLPSNIILRLGDIQNNQVFLLQEQPLMGQIMYEAPGKNVKKK